MLVSESLAHVSTKQGTQGTEYNIHNFSFPLVCDLASAISGVKFLTP